MIEDWQLVDSLGSFEEAIRAIAARWRAGEPIPASGYFQRPEVQQLPLPQPEFMLDSEGHSA
jgi:hypothetical protein